MTKMPTSKFVKIVKGTYAKIPNGTAGKITKQTQIMGLIQVDVIGHGPRNIWVKSLIGITEKEYFIKVLQGSRHGE